MARDASSCGSVFDGGFNPSSPSSSSGSSTGSNDVPVDDVVICGPCCQCHDDGDDTVFLVCPYCGSFFEPGTHCPKFHP